MLFSDHQIIRLESSEGGRQKVWELAMPAGSVTGLMSWLEAAPPGGTVTPDWSEPRSACSSGRGRVNASYEPRQSEELRMRGSTRFEGGKLVAVDLEVANGVITQAFLSGDFFIEPDSTGGHQHPGLPGAGRRVASVPDIADAVRRTSTPESP